METNNKLREALELCDRIFQDRTIVCDCDIVDEARTMVRAALAEPVRNCDVIGNTGRALAVHGFPTKSKPWGEGEWLKLIDWLFAPYEEGGANEYVGKGGGDDWLVHGEDGAAWACECEVLKKEGGNTMSVNKKTHAETTADIIAEMRRGTRLPGYWRSCDVNKILQYHADRLEAAHKRERGDCAKLREALEMLRELLGDLLRLGDAEYHDDFSNFCDIIDAALDAAEKEGGNDGQ